MTSTESYSIDDLKISDQKFKTLTNQTGKLEKITQTEFTTEALVDALFLDLAGIKQIVTNEQNDKMVTVRKYYHQALELSKGIPISKPTPSFTISISDLTPQVRNELVNTAASHPDALNHILKQAVGRLFENLDFERYHLSIARNLKVRLSR